MLAARLGYVAIILLATLKSLEFDPNLGDAAARLDDAFNPATSARDLVDAVRNMALFAGWGAVWVITGRPAMRLFTTLVGAAITGFVLSAGVETLQLFSVMRRASVLDLVTNTTGTVAGAVFMAAMVALAWGMRGWKSYVGIPAVVLAGSYLGAVFFEAVVPLDRAVPLVGAYGGPFSRFGAALSEIRIGMSAFPMTDVLLFFPLGVLGVAALSELAEFRQRYGRAAIVTGLVGVALSVAAEIGRGALGLPIELGVILVHTGAIGLGAMVAAKTLPGFTRTFRGRHRAAAAAIAYIVVLMLWSWRPFWPEWNLSDILAQFSAERFIPLAAARWRMDLFSVSDVAGQFFRYFPVGALLAVWPLRLRGPLAYWLPGLYLAFGLELGQAFVAGRYFDLGTDFAVQCAGVLVGYMVIRQAGFRPYGALSPTPTPRR
jgi:glycopeptide antibiotics resistance protein